MNIVSKAENKAVEQTPLMKQYYGIKAKYPDALVLFRMGDFFETFDQDAVIASQVLGIVLTKRANGAAAHIDLAGFPHHSLDLYLPKLVKAGYRVAICEQLEDPKLTKTIVKRGVTEVVTPGVALGDKMLDHKSNNFLASVYMTKDENGIAFIDVSTGEFFLAQGSRDYIDKLLQTFQPAEIIFSKSAQKDFKLKFGSKFYTYAIDDWVYQFDYAQDTLLKHFETQSLKGFGVEGMNPGIIAAGAIIHYLGETEHPNLKHITSLSRLWENKHIWLDKFTIRNLELIHSPHEGGISLFQVLDQTVSPMGSRMLKKWILLPLIEKHAIDERLTIVEFFIKNQEEAKNISALIKQIGDLERLISKVPLGKISPREMAHLRKALNCIAGIKNICLSSDLPYLKKIADQFNPCSLLVERIEKELTDEPPATLQKGEIIKNGVNADLDELRGISTSGKDYLARIQQKETERTGLPVKIGFNNVFGYYLEVTNKYKNQVPADWIRKQTLTNGERFITPELKEYEEKILGADEKILALEIKLFQELVNAVFDYIPPVQFNAQLIGRLDCLISFSQVALRFNYRKPEITDSFSIDLKESRHPVIERHMPAGENFVPNDIYLNNDDSQILIITGPNMAGKSALLRQTALIVLMAQTGSFVPAAFAKIGIVDRIFTRVGASDNISSGESTFMVEMNETASIMNNLSDRSLILLDEIGRGTSTYDGISIAWSLAEYLHDHTAAKPKTLFATHYHELNELADKHQRILNYNIATREVGNKVILLRKLIPGGSKHSFGIHVAKMAGMPPAIIERANEILKTLEKKSIESNLSDQMKKMPVKNYQLNIFESDPRNVKVIEELLHLNIEALSPIEALMKLNELRKTLEA